MNEKQLQLVTFEQAKKLKELGFDWDTLEFYHEDGTADIYYCVNHNANGMYSAPTVSLALKWFRDVKGYCMGIIPGRNDDYSFHIINKNRGVFHIRGYEAAESALLDEIIKHLK